MKFDMKRPKETNSFLRALGQNRRPLPIRKVKENEETVATAIDVWPFALRIQESVVASTREAINRKNELQKVIASENAQIMEKMNLTKQKYFQMTNHMEARLSEERQQLS